MKTPSLGNRSQRLDWLPQKIQRIDLVEHVAGQITAKIVDSTFLPTSLLPGELTLAEQFGVSRSVVREALRVLSAQGLVRLSHGRPAAITHPEHHASTAALGVLFKRSNATPLDLIEVRQVLEGEIAALAAERATPSDIRALEETCLALKVAISAEDAAQADVAFHVCLAKATGNPGFVRMIETLRAMFLESVRETQERCGSNVHDPILAAVKARTPDRARQAMLDHIAKTKRLLRHDAAPRKGKLEMKTAPPRRISAA